MNLKKNNHHIFAKLAFNQASINQGSTGTNPSVGCVLEKNGTVLSSAVTAIGGRPHAESIALDKCNKLSNANIYISLEPCTHYGKTPPCTSKIIRNNIKKVFFSSRDLDKRTNGKSIKILKKNKINVQTGFYKKEVNYFYKSYFLYLKKKLPLVDAKIAISRDYFTKNKKNKWITNEDSRKRAHLIRSKYDCLITTSKSINDDNSLLNCRIEGLEKKSPSIAIIDRKLTLQKNLKIFKKKSYRNIYLFTEKNNPIKEKYLKSKGIKIIKISKMSDKKNYKEILLKLVNLKYSRFLLESGLILLKFFLKANFIHNLYIFQSDKLLKKNGFNYTNSLFLKKLKIKKKN